MAYQKPQRLRDDQQRKVGEDCMRAPAPIYAVQVNLAGAIGIESDLAATKTARSLRRAGFGQSPAIGTEYSVFTREAREGHTLEYPRLIAFIYLASEEIHGCWSLH